MRDLADNEVKHIVQLHREFNGLQRIHKITGIGIWQIRSILRNETYIDITGGNLPRGRRPQAMWRHSTRTFEEVCGS